MSVHGGAPPRPPRARHTTSCLARQVLAVSYFIEEDAAARLARHGVLLDRSKYVAGGVVVVDPRTGGVKWSVHLDLTTDETKLRAYIYSSPAVAGASRPPHAP